MASLPCAILTSRASRSCSALRCERKPTDRSLLLIAHSNWQWL